jgi:hypothetical protein
VEGALAKQRSPLRTDNPDFLREAAEHLRSFMPRTQAEIAASLDYLAALMEQRAKGLEGAAGSSPGRDGSSDYGPRQCLASPAISEIS